MGRAERGGFRPRLVPTLIAVPAVLVLAGLGTWQLDRLAWKTALNEERAARLALPPVRLDAPPSAAVPESFRRVTLAGRFDHAREFHLGPRKHKSQPGIHVVTPLVTAAGWTVLIDRGFVPDALRDPARRGVGQIAGPTEVTGLVRLPTAPGRFTPANEPDRNQWFFIDLAAMAGRAGAGTVATFYVEAGPEPVPGGVPIGGLTPAQLPSNHLSYALTWYTLAVALVAIYILSERRTRRRDPDR
ncbi:MAG: SURF1 family protein [Alphaproteobacteria bacterium]|nr:SURF1 family protein [Alphaproteobacteria bacterium]